MNPHEWWAKDLSSPPWLFKLSRQREARPRALPEHITEKLASELARLMGVPAARVELRVRGKLRGALVESVRPSGWELHSGQELMADAVDGYVPRDPYASGHSPANIQLALRGMGPPPNIPAIERLGAFDVAAGYLVFDALIAHTDRHDRNWAVLRPPPSSTAPDSLCASFDHAASLGHTLTEARCTLLLADKEVARWAGRGRAGRFERTAGGARATLLAVAKTALGLCGPVARDYWLAALLSVDRASVEEIVAAAPGIANATREFVATLVMTNRERLLDATA